MTGTGSALHFNIQGRPPRTPAEFKIGSYRVASAGYLRTLGVPLIAGRWIEDHDREGASPVVVVNSVFARTYFPGQSPIGQHMQLGATPDPEVPCMEIVGVVGGVKQALASESAAEIYVPFRQADQVLPVGAMSIVVRTAGDPPGLANALRAVVARIDPAQPVTGITTMEENVAKSISEPRFRSTLLAAFAGIAVVLRVASLWGCRRQQRG